VFPPGGSVDQVARIIAQQLTKQTGQQVIVENRGGASRSTGTGAVAKADPDGYTLAVVFDTHAVNPALIPNLPFDTLRDLTPVMLVGKGGMALVTYPDQPYKSFRDVVAAAKAKPGSVSYGTIGAGSLGHLAMAQLGKAVKTPAVMEKLSAQGMEVLGAPPAELDALVRKEMPRWAKVVKDNNIKSGD